MTTFDGEVLRTQTDKFDRGLRGFAIDEVDAYLARLALVADIAHSQPDTPALPADLTAQSIRTKAFTAVWTGYDRHEVDAFLEQLADDVQAFVLNPPARVTALHLPASIAADLQAAQTSGILDGATVEVNGHVTPVTFYSAEKVASAITEDVAEHGVAAFSNAIVVNELSQEAVHAAFDHLLETKVLHRLFGRSG